jgi:GxxExxY protein
MNANRSDSPTNPEVLSRRVIGCAFEVSNKLGAGFLEVVYENALCVELTEQRLQFERQKSLVVTYKGRMVGSYVADIVVEGTLLLELKALSQLTSDHDAQVLNYLRATGLTVGLLLNFGTARLGIRRLVWQHDDTHRI